MNGDTKRAMILGAGAVAGGWGGAVTMARLGASLGFRFGPAGTVAGAAVGALIGVGLCKMMMGAPKSLDDIEGEFEIETDEAA